jgi:ubiquinol-cytochrome c reductase cytochrome b subunit
MNGLTRWLDERTGYRRVLAAALHEPVPGGASFWYVFGSLLAFLLILQGTTGVLLAFYYSPSSSDAWASVAYIQDSLPGGALVRGLHHHGASAIVIVAILHLCQTAIFGAYKKPREMNWIVGVMLLGLILGFALTGYLLPWDQTGYWATKVATGIAGSTPLIGEQLQEIAQGGNEYGNLTLTRFYALHVLVLPALTTVLVVMHVALFRKHGVTARWGRSADELARTTQPFWPDQLWRDALAMTAAFAALVAYVTWISGAPLTAPADASSNFDARPEWYFRALFQLLKYFEGSAETMVALGAPVVIGGLILAVPFVDRGAEYHPRRRVLPLAMLAVVLGGVAALTVVSYRLDAADGALAERMQIEVARAARARALARANGVPAAGGTAVFTTARFYRARTAWAAHCASCHQGDERKGPEIGAGYNARPWIRGFLSSPNHDRYFGRTKLARTDLAMQPVEQTGEDLDALVEAIYAETGASDADAARVARGRALFDEGCTDCHSRVAGTPSESAPHLGGRGSAEHLRSLITDAGSARHFAVGNEMPQIEELTSDDVRALADYLVWLRSASDADLRALGAL